LSPAQSRSSPEYEFGELSRGRRRSRDDSQAIVGPNRKLGGEFDDLLIRILMFGFGRRRAIG
jgi:hypothetical protein